MLVNNNIDSRDSVANASAANVSMMRLTHSNCILVNGDSLSITPPIKAINTATMLTVI